MGTLSQPASYSYDSARVHALQRDFTPPRPLYYMLIPMILVVMGILSWLISGDMGLLIACVTATVISGYTLWVWLFHRAPTRFSTLLAMSLLLGYGGGALNTWLTLSRGPLTLGQYMGLSHGILARGMAAVLFSSAALYFFGEIFEKPLFPENYYLRIDSSMRSVIYFSAFGMLIGYATHSMVFAGVASSEGHISILGMFLAWLYPSVASLSVPAFLTANRGRERILAGLAAFVFLLMFVLGGRRLAIYTTVEVVFVLGLTGYKWRVKALRSVLLVAFFAAVIATCALVFMLLRIAPVRQVFHGQPSIQARIQAADKLVKHGDALTLAVAATRQNVETRTFVLAFLANILDASLTKTPALGHDALSLLESTIPSAIYPDKDRFFSEELLVDRQFGFGYGDQANSILTGGATDFGLLGMIFYPLALIVLARMIYGLLSPWLHPLPLLLVALALIFLFLQTEVILSGYFSILRNVIIFGIVMQIISLAPRLLPHSEYAH
jgi:hypothetical protein